MRRRTRNHAKAHAKAEKYGEPRFNSEFWEVPLSGRRSALLCEEDGLWHETRDESLQRLVCSERVPVLLATLHQWMEEVLTPRQSQVVRRYFLLGQTEDEIAEELGIARQVVNQHLHGIRRGGRRVGGAIAKLRKEAKRRKVEW